MGRTNNEQQPRIICICGRPLSGKTTVASMLGESFGWPVVEADAVGLGVTRQQSNWMPSAAEADPPETLCEYPYHEALLVEWERPDCYCQYLSRVAKSLDSSVLLLVGLRSVQMLRTLRRAYARRVQLLYIAAGARVCSCRYAARTGSSQNSYFRLLRYAIETDQEALRQTAQLVVANASTPAALRHRVLTRVRNDGRISRSPLEHCRRCGRYAPVHFRTPGEKAPVCRECYEVMYNTEVCSICHQPRPVHKRCDQGAPMCKNCYQRLGNLQACVVCGKLRPVYRRNEQGDPICRRCGRRRARHQRVEPPTPR